MAEPIGIASGLLNLITFALGFSVSLYQTLKTFQSNKKDIRDLKSELAALNDVLQSLQELASTNEPRFEVLSRALLRCGQVCEEFEEVIAKNTRRSGESKTSFQDWTKLQYMGSGIDGFKEMLAGYKATISIAIGDASLCTATANADAIQAFKDRLEDTRSNLQDHLEKLNDKLEELRVLESSGGESERTEISRMSETIASFHECLAVCARASRHAEGIRKNAFEDVSASVDAHQVIVSTIGDRVIAKRVTAEDRSTQWLGQMSDATLQQLPRSRGMDVSSCIAAKTSGKPTKGIIRFEDQYGAGHSLE